MDNKCSRYCSMVLSLLINHIFTILTIIIKGMLMKS